MGILNVIGNAIGGVVKKVSNIINPVNAYAPETKQTKNVKEVLAQSLNPFSQQKPVANVDNKIVKAGLEFVASSPYTTAGLVAGGVSAAGRSIATSAISKIGTIPKIVAVGGTAAGTIAGLASPKIAEKEIRIITAVTPENLTKTIFGGASTFEKITSNKPISNEQLPKSQAPEQSKLTEIEKYISENKTTLEVLGISAGIAVGFKSLPALISYITGQRQLAEEKKQTDIYKQQLEAMKNPPIAATPAAAAPSLNSTAPAAAASAPTTPTMPQTEVVRVGGSSTSSKRKKRSSKVVMPSIRQNVNVVVQNRNSSTGIRLNKRYLNRELLIS